jgi:hypothetical protein
MSTTTPHEERSFFDRERDRLVSDITSVSLALAGIGAVLILIF